MILFGTKKHSSANEAMKAPNVRKNNLFIINKNFSFIVIFFSGIIKLLSLNFCQNLSF